MTIKDLKPEIVWKYFHEITQVPRPSKKEGKIIEYLLEFAKKNNLNAVKDDAGNVLITKPATKGYENLPVVILQSHIDMVCEKNNDTVHDFENDPIQTYVDGDWLKAKGTTLGADNGLGMAAELAVLASDDIEHGPIECLFTIDEETGLTGAYALGKDFLKGKILINLDTEEEGELYIGCAGGKGTTVTFNYKEDQTPMNYYWFNIQVKGLNGGHSGSEIHKGLGNANKILNRYLWALMRKTDMRLATIDGGNLHNAIAREASAVAGVPVGDKEMVAQWANVFAADIEGEYRGVEPNVKIHVETATEPSFVIDEDTTHNLLNAICACPHGVMAMSNDIPGLVEASTNLASVKMKDNNRIVIGTSQRSSTESLKNSVANMITAVFTLAKAKVEQSEGYPGWKPNPNSAILDVAKASYKRLYNAEPKVMAIHAGLECGLFLEKYPYLDMVSCGPTITDAHSPAEQVNIPSVAKWWPFLLDVLKNIPAEK
ncbi:dipeptidase D [Dysgonomonas sp. PH5-45]|uniref:aminoacyl-histidine dipeptidase n=1 Tax=unclassified Dysgonomonas TaxID=2630389 RepID=UPI0024757F8E|nr:MULTISPECIES: aminoacyl-histidine dipeptidase [unclassified Dysgonomonas]MDH6354999.1 dipeptidase D [Dysgonomonas sp. PH5-45]MDH6387876.1 dipeptidase D [Dysgonomonas sp. PH5-37]